MPSADQVPVKSSHSTMLWLWWVVLIAGSTGSALRAACPRNHSHHIGCPMRRRAHHTWAIVKVWTVTWVTA